MNLVQSSSSTESDQTRSIAYRDSEETNAARIGLEMHACFTSDSAERMCVGVGICWPTRTMEQGSIPRCKADRETPEAAVENQATTQTHASFGTPISPGPLGAACGQIVAF